MDWWKVVKAATALGTAAGTLLTAGAVLHSTYKHSKASQASTLYKKYPKVGRCMAEIGYFYQERQRLKDDEKKIPHSDRKRPDRMAIAKDWAQEKRSKSQKPSEEVKEVDECRQVTTNFFKHAYFLLDEDLVDKNVFEESFYARSGNFKRLVEPLDEADFPLVNQAEKYTDGENRPAIYRRIEKAENDPKLEKYF